MTNRKPPGATVRNGYGAAHKRLRKQLEPEVQSGRAICWRCNQHIRPQEKWVLGHDDDRRFYRGPEHQYCGFSASNQHSRKPPAPKALDFFK